MKNLIVISHNFYDKRFYLRWLDFAKKNTNFNVLLLSPKKLVLGSSKEYTHGTINTFKSSALKINNFQIITDV